MTRNRRRSESDCRAQDAASSRSPSGRPPPEQAGPSNDTDEVFRADALAMSGRMVAQQRQNDWVSSLVVVDPTLQFRDRLVTELGAIGVGTWGAPTIAALDQVIALHRPEAVVVELVLPDGSWRDVVRRFGTPNRVAILTSRGSIATAVAATRLGVAAYLSKPVSAIQLLDALSVSSEIDTAVGRSFYSPPSLDRAVWEIICQAVETCGSISGAARMLRVDRRSLRRMLQKDPPPR